MISIGLTVALGDQAKDLQVDLEEHGSISEIRAAIAGSLGIDAAGYRLRVARTGKLLNDSQIEPMSGLLHGDTVLVEFADADAPAPPAVQLVRIGANAGGRIFTLTAPETRVGRGARGTGSLVLDDPTVSSAHATLLLADSGVELIDHASTNGTWVNGHRVAKSRVLVHGDKVRFGDSSAFEVKAPWTSGAGQHLTAKDGFLFFNRPPRRALPSPERTLTIPKPPDVPPSRRLPIPMMVVPVVMGLLIFLVSQNAMFLLFAGMGPIMAGWNWFDDRRSGRGRFLDASSSFRDRLQQTGTELADGRAASLRWRATQLPDVGVLADRATRLSEALWDRRTGDEDYLHVRLGPVDLPSLVKLEIPASGDPVLLQEAQEIAAQFQTDPGVPLPLAIGDLSIVGIAGPEEERSSLARWIAVQIACRHSPRDVMITALVSRDGSKCEWMKWLPHSSAANEWLGSDPGGTAGSLLGSMSDFAEYRRANDGADMPTIVAIVDPDAGLSDADLRRLVGLSANPASGLILIWLSAQHSRLPGECAATIEFADSGRIRLDVGSLGSRAVDVRPDGISFDDAEAIARALAPLRDPGASSRAAGIPERVGLLEVLDLDDMTGEAIVRQWSNHDGGMRAPIGINERGEVAHLDLRSIGDGPHGLVAGTTGAGKSEFLQSFVAALAYRYPPSHLTFLFVDYKGDSAFKDCVRLPHFVGQLTNLDEGLADRARRSLQAELVYRQRLFSEHGVKDLDDMRTKVPDAAPPALLIVFDEFASLVDDVPEFVDGVVDIAEKGRSLGVHMILATQTPGGAINRKIQNCVNFRVALRLKEESESSEVIKSPEAARIPSDLPGRAVVRLGSGDLSNFQSAYAGGSSVRDEGPGVSARTMLLAGARPTNQRGKPDPSDTTDLAALVDAATSAARVLQLAVPRRPWLDELPSALVLDSLRPPAELPATAAPIGLVDLPDKQIQEEYVLDFGVTPNVLILGGSGTGKTTLLRTVALALAKAHTSAAVQIYGLDFAGRGLGVLESVPHVGGVARVDEPARVRSLVAMLMDAVQERRRVIGSAGSAAAYRQAGGHLPTTVVLVDGLLPLMMTLEDLDGGVFHDAFLQLVGEGPSVGIHFAMATDQPQRVPMIIGNTVAERLVLSLPNQDAYYAAGVGAAPAGPLPRGRAVSTVLRSEVQIAVAALSSELVDGSAQAEYAGVLSARLETEAANPVPKLRVLSDMVIPADIDQASPQEGVVVLGIDDVSLRPQSVDFGRTPTLLVLGPDLSGRSSLLAWIRRALELSSVDGFNSVLIAPGRSDAIRSGEWDHVFGEPMAGIGHLEDLAQGEDAMEHRPWTLIALDDCDELLEAPIGGRPEERQSHARYSQALDQIVRSARDRRYVVISSGRFSALSRSQGWARRMLHNQQAIILSPASLSGGYTDPVFNVRLPRRTDYRPIPGRGVLIRRADADLIQTVLPD